MEALKSLKEGQELDITQVHLMLCPWPDVMRVKFENGYEVREPISRNLALQKASQLKAFLAEKNWRDQNFWVKLGDKSYLHTRFFGLRGSAKPPEVTK